MLVIVVEAAPPRLRGRLTVWMLEIRAGVYVGRVSKRHRERIWQRVCNELSGEPQSSAIAAWTARNEAGYEFATFGENRRIPVDFDGLSLISFTPLVDSEAQEKKELEDFLAEEYYNEIGDDIYFEE